MRAQASSKIQAAATVRQEPARTGHLQRKCDCGQHTVGGGECSSCYGKREETLQRSAITRERFNSIPPVVNEVLRSTGRPLDAATRNYFEPRFGQDFSRVRVHTDARAAESARAVNALAFTVGHEVVFGAGQYAPGTKGGQRLLAHELTHTIQQSHGLSGDLSQTAPDSPLEAEADRTARLVVSSDSSLLHDSSFPSLRTGMQLQREPDPNKTPPPAGPYTGYRPFPPSPPPPPPPTACLVSPDCSKPIPGSAWDFSHKVEAQQDVNRKSLDQDKKQGKVVPNVRRADALIEFANKRSPGLLKAVTDVIVNPAIGESAGAQLGDCAVMPQTTPTTNPQCIEVPDKMEKEAAIFNNPGNQKVGEVPREEWQFNTMRMFTHEIAHAKFDKAPPAGITVTDEISTYELDELNAILSEFPLGYAQVMSSSKSDEEKKATIQRAINTYIEKTGEGIRGILKKLRCINPCSKVNTSVKQVFNAQTAGWTPEQRKFYLDELTKPERNLDWPI